MSAPDTMQAMVCNYLAERRRLGFELKSPSRTLMSFASYVDTQEHDGPLTVELMAQWARQDKWQRGDPATWARRLKLLRPFTRYLRQFEPRTEVPDETIFGPIQEQLTPHIYSEQEIVDLLAAARALRPSGGLRPVVYETLFGLIATAGLRVAEAAHLLEMDVDFKFGLLTIRKTKFAKSRQLPLHPTTVEALRRYRDQRRHHVAVTDEMPFFVSSKGKGLSLRQVERVFAALRQQLGWISRGGHDQPRIQDLRHTFAVRRVTLWQTHGVEIDQAMLALSTYMGHAKISNTYWYLTAVPELMAVAAGSSSNSPSSRRWKMPNTAQRTPPAPSFCALVQAFFAEYLIEQRALSPHTVAAYRDTFLLFLAFVEARLGKSPADLSLPDITSELLLAFLDHLEQERRNTVRSRNARLAALRAFLKFASHRDLSSLHTLEQALGVPMKRFERPMLGFLSREEMLAVIGTPGNTWFSQRDHLLLVLLYNTGARVSEIIAVTVADVVLRDAACVHLHGKGRKQRAVPLWRSTVQKIHAWLRRNPQLETSSTLLPNRDGYPMTRSNVRQRMALAVQSASKRNGDLTKRHITPHWVRHYLPFLTISCSATLP